MPVKKKPLSELTPGTRTWYRRRKELGLTEHPPVIPDTSIFDFWSSHMAWLLGIIWSDGCLFGNTIEVCSKDLQLIDLILSLIPNSTYRTKNNGRHVRVYWTCKEAASSLRLLGLSEAKSLTAPYPNIPDKYEDDFMRGLFDGDGHVGLSKKRKGQQVADLRLDVVTASKSMCEGISSWMNRRGVEFCLQIREADGVGYKNPLYRIHVQKQKSKRKVFGLFYPHWGVCCLHRKFVLFHQWYETPRATSGRPKKRHDAEYHAMNRVRARNAELEEAGQLRLF